MDQTHNEFSNNDHYGEFHPDYASPGVYSTFDCSATVSAGTSELPFSPSYSTNAQYQDTYCIMSNQQPETETFPYGPSTTMSDHSHSLVNPNAYDWNTTLTQDAMFPSRYESFERIDCYPMNSVMAETAAIGSDMAGNGMAGANAVGMINASRIVAPGDSSLYSEYCPVLPTDNGYGHIINMSAMYPSGLTVPHPNWPTDYSGTSPSHLSREGFHAFEQYMIAQAERKDSGDV